MLDDTHFFLKHTSGIHVQLKILFLFLVLHITSSISLLTPTINEDEIINFSVPFNGIFLSQFTVVSVILSIHNMYKMFY